MIFGLRPRRPCTHFTPYWVSPVVLMQATTLPLLGIEMDRLTYTMSSGLHSASITIRSSSRQSAVGSKPTIQSSDLLHSTILLGDLSSTASLCHWAATCAISWPL